MLIAGSALKGYQVEATDGHLGTVKNFLFDDGTWKIRWLVIDTGFWLSARQVLVHPSAIGEPDHAQLRLPVALTKAQIEASPGILQDQPVTMQMQRNLYGYYGWDPYWGPNFFGVGSFAPFALGGAFAGEGTSNVQMDAPPMHEIVGALGRPEAGREPIRHGVAAEPQFDRNRGETPAERAAMEYEPDQGDPHLRSMTALRGYHVHASDGSIGHVENFLVDDASWAIRYIVVDTSNWWVGAHVLIAPYAVAAVDWGGREVRLSVTRAQVRSSPAWNPAAAILRAYQEGLHRHYGWPGYGW